MVLINLKFEFFFKGLYLLKLIQTSWLKKPLVYSFKTRLGLKSANVNFSLASSQKTISKTTNPVTVVDHPKPSEPKEQLEAKKIIDDCGDKPAKDPLKDIYPCVVNEFKSNLLKFEMLNKCAAFKVDANQLLKRFSSDCKCNSKHDCEKMADSRDLSLDKIIDCLKRCKCNRADKNEKSTMVNELIRKSKSMNLNVKRLESQKKSSSKSGNFLASILNSSGACKLRSLIKI